MRWLDFTAAEPAADLAWDEALLDAVELGGDEVLRVYEPRRTCVVVGYGNSIAREADRQACVDARVPILRRISGGGTVVLGPGCLAYSLVLQISRAPDLSTVGGTNRYVMERNRVALERLLGRPVSVRGHTDLTLGDRKFSGNAQRRRRQALLFHGTFLLASDLERIPRLLPMPSAEPDYRDGRGHLDFVTNLGIEAAAVKVALATAWNATEAWTASLEAPVQQLMNERYANPDWHARF